MQRGTIGTYHIRTSGSESIRAFLPNALPPKPPVAVTGKLQDLFGSAMLELGRLDSITASLPNPTLLLYTYVRKEAVLSSQIEGTQSSLSDLLLFENETQNGVVRDDVLEVSNYVKALDHGLDRIRKQNFPISNRLIREVHAKLLSSGRGQTKAPGQFRRSQNWIGGTRPGNAHFVPPPHTEVADCMAALERFIHADDDGIPSLLRAAMTHVQFETIHPFLDGNGRVGRLLITLMVCDAGLLKEPLLYLSLYLKQHREEYYNLLNRVRHKGDWEAWLVFFLDGVRETAAAAVATAKQLLKVFRRDQQRIHQNAGRRAGSALQLHQALKARVVVSLPSAAHLAKVSYPTATSAMALLIEYGLAEEITGRSRNRLFAYREYLAILSEGMEVP